MPIILNIPIFLALTALAGGCASLPSGFDAAKSASQAWAWPERTRLGKQIEPAGHEHPGHSGFRLIQAGADGFLTRMRMIAVAEKAIDLQYYIFHQDKTGQLLTEAILRAADRGVRVRVLVDDGETEPGDQRIVPLAAHPNIQVRVFNPFAYRGDNKLLKTVEFIFNASRLDYRMHNKLLVVDNAVALVGGRNIGDQYFQIDPESQFADDDVFSAGSIVRELSVSFDEFWNSGRSIPMELLDGEQPSVAGLNRLRLDLGEERRELRAEGLEFVKRVADGKPFEEIMDGRLPLVWAPARLIYDSPYKMDGEKGQAAGKLLRPAVREAAAAVRSELLMTTPFLIPDDDAMRMFKKLRGRDASIRMLTNSLESTPLPLAHAGYMHYRTPLLEAGVELYEIRARLGNSRGSGQTPALSRHGNYSLHAKIYVFDRQKLYIGSMNFDQRSKHLNTEIGLIIDSPLLAEQMAARFQAMTQPANAYKLGLRANPGGGDPSLIWQTQESGKAVVYDIEPARDESQRLKVDSLTLLPDDDEL